MRELILLCETAAVPPDDIEADPSFEIRVISDLVNANSPKEEIQVQGCGGCRGLGAVAAYLEKARGRHAVAAYVQDRDYRPLKWAEDSYTDGKRGFMWRRHEVENYLAEPEVVVQAMETLRASLTELPSGPPSWADALPVRVQAVHEVLSDCARQRAVVEAASMTLWSLQGDIDCMGRVQVRQPVLVHPSGALFERWECVSAIRRECERVITGARTLQNRAVLDPDQAERRYEAILAEISTVEYRAQRRFLRDFGGAELLTSFHRWLSQSCGVRIRRQRLMTELALAAPAVYTNNPRLFDPDDFRELAEGIVSLAEARAKAWA
jgi:hypothetical protein